MTNFFEHQQTARARTFWLILLFIVSTLLITALIYPFAVFLFGRVENTFYDNQHDPFLLLGSLAGVWSVIGIGSALKSNELSEGGPAVASMLGGRQIQGNTREGRERRLLNIVEEMALASGLPMPAVYVLDDEEGINAFAAGMAPGDAVVAVSRGCLNYLTRDELQGVVAHEFSHILNGDMRLNFRMMILIAGMIGLSVLGRILIEVAGRGRSNSNSKDNTQALLLLIGVALYIIGILGAFFGWLLQAAVSRQREYLADASAVQFTRNPLGIAGALKKIGAHAEHGLLKAPQAAEAAHLFFAQGLFQLFATHPPLEERIKRVEPTWDGKYPPVRVTPEPQAEELKRPAKPLPGLTGIPGIPGVPSEAVLPVLAGMDAAQTVERVGTVPHESKGYAVELSTSLPERLREAISEPFQARAVVFGLLLDPDPAIRKVQLAALQRAAEPQTADLVEIFEDPLKQVPESLRLPLLDLCLPSLRQMSPRQHREFRRLVDTLIEADQRMSVFEYVLRCVLERHLDQAFGTRPVPTDWPDRATIEADSVVVLAFLAWEGASDDTAARAAFTTAARQYLGSEPPPMPVRDSSSVESLDERLRRLGGAPLRERRRLLLACVTLILADGKTTVREFELARAISDVLGLPMPPLPMPQPQP